MICCAGTLCVFFVFFFFFFKQKTAYEIMPSLVGSEMCIRDRVWVIYKYSNYCLLCICSTKISMLFGVYPVISGRGFKLYVSCLLYTSDAADDLLCVDLGGRRIIKKKKKCNKSILYTSDDECKW